MKWPATNRTIGRFHLDGIPPAPRGIPQIEVTFDIDANGILNVAAKDKATGKEQTIRIEASSGLGEDEIKKMVHDAEVNADADKARREEITIRNECDQLVYQTEKNMGEMSDKLSDTAKSKLGNALNTAKEAIKGSDINAIKSAHEGLNAAWHEASQEMYAQGDQASAAANAASQAAGAEQKSGTGSSTGGSGDSGDSGDSGAVDADYEVVDE